MDLPFLRPLLATAVTTGGAAAALEVVLEAQGPIPSAVAAVLLALAALIWEHVRRMRDERGRDRAPGEPEEP